MDEKDLVCYESFSKLYLISKVLGESVHLKSISSKMKVGWKTLGESCFMDLGNDFFLIKFSTSEDCSKLWEDRPFSSKNKLLFFKDGEKSLTLLVRPLSLPLFGLG